MTSDFVCGLAIERILNRHPPHLLATLLQQTQSILFPEAWQTAFGIAACTSDPTADALLPDILFTLFRARVRRVRGRRRGRGKIRYPVSWEWSRRVEELAALLAPHLEQQTDSPPPPGNPFATPGRPRSCSGPGSPAGGCTGDPGDLANPFLGSGDPSRQGPPTFPSGVGSRPGSRRGPSRRLDFQQLDEYYSRQAGSLRVEDNQGEVETQEPEMLPVGFLDYAPAHLRDLASSQIDWFRTRCSPPTEDNPSGLALYRLTDPLEIPADAFDPSSRDVPHLLLMVDSSGSMRFNPRSTGTARGQYDVVLMACWGLFLFLEEQHLTDRVWVNALNFSSRTLDSGWHRGNALEPVKRVLATYEGGGTILNTSAVRTARQTAPGHFLALAMTDGNVGNTPQVLRELGHVADAAQGLALLHIGRANAFTKGVEKLGGCVHITPSSDALVGLCLDLARTSYATEQAG